MTLEDTVQETARFIMPFDEHDIRSICKFIKYIKKIKRLDQSCPWMPLLVSLVVLRKYFWLTIGSLTSLGSQVNI